jgi:hypothetical protein
MGLGQPVAQFFRAGAATLLAVLLGSAVAPDAAFAQDVVPPKAYTTTPGGINASDGNFVYSETDLSMGPLTLERFHRGGQRQPNDAMFGTNFSSSFDIYVGRYTPTSGQSRFVIVHTGSSASGQYWQSKTTPASIGSDNADADKGILSWNGSSYVYIDSSGTIFTFTASISPPGLGALMTGHRVTQIDFPDGRRQTFSYTAAGQPKLVEDSSGYAIVFDYNGSNDVSAACIFKRSETYVSTATTCAGAPLKTTYGYTSGRLTSVVDVMNATTSYTNTLTGVTCVIPPGYGTCKYSQSGGPSHTAPSFGNTQALADGGSWQVSGQDWGVVPRGDEGSPAPYDGHVEVTVTDPSNQTTSLSFTKSSPYAMTDPLGRSTMFQFYGGETLSNAANWGGHSYGSMLVEATYPEGDKYQADYNGPFRAITAERHVAKPGSGQPTLSKTYGYGSCISPGTYQNCGKPIWIQDPAGKRTDFTYATHGGILTQMAPAPVTNGARPLTVTTWVQRYAWVKNAGGTLVQASLPTWVKATETVCQTVAGSSPPPVCDGSALQTVTTYEYGANGTGQSLLVRGVVVTANGTSLRTCYGYDANDRKIWETQPNANLSTCS